MSNNHDREFVLTPRKIVLCMFVLWRCEYFSGVAVLDQLAKKHECCELRYAGGLLHIMSNNHDREFVLKLLYQLFDLGRRYGVERRRRFVE
jgi:hypothetical protein